MAALNNIKQKYIIGLILIIYIGMVSESYAETFYVDPQTGNIANDGSAEHPWSTLQEVFTSNKITTVVAPGDTLLLRSGYHGSVSRTGLVNSDYITIKAQSGHTPTLSRLWLYGGAKWKIDGLTISPEFAPVPPTGNAVILSRYSGQSNDMILENCIVYLVDDVSGFTANDWLAFVKVGYGIMATYGTNIVIRNNKIKNVGYGIVFGGCIGITVANNTIDGFVGDGMTLGGKNIVIENNVIKNLYEVDPSSHNDGIQVFTFGFNVEDYVPIPNENIIIRGNTIIQFDPERTDPWKGAIQGMGLFDGPYYNLRVENNIVFVTHYHGITIMGGDDIEVLNNIVVDIDDSDSMVPAISCQDGKDGSIGNYVVRNNLATRYNMADTGIIVFENNMLYDDYGGIDEFFVDYQNHDFRHKSTSPAIDAGSSVLAPLVDIIGTSRPQGSAIDLGAYESPYSVSSDPTIESVIISPNSGYVRAGNSITIVVMSGNNEAGLIPSGASINSRQVSLSDIGDGTYTGIYTVQANDEQGVNIEATDITLRNAAGDVSEPASSKGSTLKVDTLVPIINSVSIGPNTGVVKPGDTVIITVVAFDNEAGLAASDAMINSKSIPLTDKGDGTYIGIYIVESADEQGVNIEAAGITLTDTAGNVSDSASSSGSTLKVDTIVTGINQGSFNFSISQNYPNPFNNNTNIEFIIPRLGDEKNGTSIQFVIYNIFGQQVRELIYKHQLPGKYYVIWDGRDENGNKVAAGQYIYQMRVGNFKAIKKMIFLK